MNKIIAKIKQIKVTPKFVLKVFFYLFLHFLYHLCEYGNQWAGSLRGGMWKIGDSGIPYATLPGLFTSLCTLILIAWVVFYGKMGYYTSITILILRFIRLTIKILNHHLSFLPVFFPWHYGVCGRRTHLSEQQTDYQDAAEIQESLPRKNLT